MIQRTILALALAVLVLTVLVTTTTLIYGRPGNCAGCKDKHDPGDVAGGQLVDLPTPAPRGS